MMLFTSSSIDWTKEIGYTRGILLYYNFGPQDHIQVQLTTIESGDSVPTHHHVTQTEYIFLLEGVLTFFFDKRTLVLKPESLLVIEPGENHSTKNTGKTRAKFITFKIHGNAKDTVWDHH
jgi:quercetin dioxygenase-like cupin family protein